MTNMPSATDLELLSMLGAATLYEAQGATGAMDPAIKPVDPSMRLAGPAFPVMSPPGDNLMLHLAVTRARRGDILVVDAEGSLDIALWGDVLAAAAQAAGIAGLVIDGAARDAAELTTMGFATFARGLSIRGPGKAKAGTIGEPVTCGGISVKPGDIVVGDRDGVVVLDAARWRETLAAARTRQSKEDTVKAELLKGRSTVEQFGLAATLKQLGLA